MSSQSTITGAAGQHIVMGELLRRGYIAALAPEGVPTVDILVTERTGGELCSLQVKTRQEKGSDGGWHMGEKHEQAVQNRLFYCFVDLGKNPSDRPAIWVVPSAVVAAALRESHVSWLAMPGRNGKPHKQTDMRRFLPDYETKFPDGKNPYPSGWLNEYRDAWHLLSLDTSTVKTMPVSK